MVVEPEHEAPVATGPRVQLAAPGCRRHRVQLRQGQRRPRGGVAALHVARPARGAPVAAPGPRLCAQRRRSNFRFRRRIFRLELRHDGWRQLIGSQPASDDLIGSQVVLILF